ncbi:MAG: nitrous oxide reductase accessory protein NosL [Gammaproteobacteria bacterium]
MKARTAAGLLFLLLLVAAGTLGLWHSAGHGDAAGRAPREPGIHDPVAGHDPFAARSVPAEARCPVCGMYPARYPRWAAQLIFKDGKAVFFDSPLELFRFLLDMGHYHDAHGPDDVARAYVSDAGDGRWVSIVEAHFVEGSGLLGPMRNPDLPAFAELEAAETFVAERGGRLIRMEQVTLDLLHALEGAGHPQ